MTDVNIQWIACARKRQYPSRKAALNTVKGLKRNGKVEKKLRAYECPHCGLWHLSSR